MKVRIRQRTSALFFFISADQTPMAMVKLELISTAVLTPPSGMLSWCDADYERRIVPVAVDQIGGKQSAEEHDFRQQEEPHAEVGGVVLLRHGLEMMALIAAGARDARPSAAIAGYCTSRVAIRRWSPLFLSWSSSHS